jgi:hypothetical protein
MLKLRHEANDRPDHFQVYTGQVRIGTIYKISGNPGVRSPSAPGNHLPEKKSRSGAIICRPRRDFELNLAH